ncbi:hypothetical protein GCM10010446_61250 [Streptomyces enissocaesilis]|uniref:Transposase n=1 Tax=Streptomyces enissocaesilis TaxID=332589 RepID=A0ABP6K6R0_9ACTN
MELEQAGAAEAAWAPQVADDQLIAVLVHRARSEGLQLTGESGLLQQVLERPAAPPGRAPSPQPLERSRHMPLTSE